jgi:hypothetical protein
MFSESVWSARLAGWETDDKFMVADSNYPGTGPDKNNI